MVAAVSFETQMFLYSGRRREQSGGEVRGGGNAEVRLCDNMLILHFEDKCAAELITEGERGG